MSGTTATDDPTPSTATMSPLNQQLIGNLSAMTPEQLQETVFKLRGSPQGQIAQQMLARKRIMSANPGQQTQPSASGAPQQYSLGGSMEIGKGVHIPMHGISAPSGLLHTAGPGRTDNLHIAPHADSYVLPSAVVSGVGEGNTLAGAKALDMALHTGPHGIPMPNSPHRAMGMPKPPPASPPGGFGGGGGGPPGAGGFGLARGGEAPKRVPIIAAGGEYILTPEQCRMIGGGDVKKGHRILDAFCVHIIKRTANELKKLKPPVKS